MGEPENLYFINSGFWGSVGTLIYGFEYTEKLKTYDIWSNNSLVNQLLMVSGSWLMAQREPWTINH